MSKTPTYGERARGRRGSSTVSFVNPSATIAIALLIVATAPSHARAECNRPGVTVAGSAEEQAEACAAVDEVLRYFNGVGRPVALELVIRFQHVVIVDLADSAAKGLGSTPVSGYYNAAKKEVRVTSSNSTWARERRPWGLSWNQALAYSILRHEVAHAAIYQLLGEDSYKLPRAWHEALAYAIQFDLMRPDLRVNALAQYPNRQAFASTLHVNDFVYGADPDGFAVAAYRTYLRDGGAQFLKRALDFELEMINLGDLP